MDCLACEVNSMNSIDPWKIDTFFQRSIGFVEENGSSLEKARLRCILHDKKPRTEDIESFIQL